MADILRALVNASERAALVARACCKSSSDQSLLVAEKQEDANARFDKDFKTIADVLAQESAKAEIGLHCPALARNVRGEECSEIGGVTIKIMETEEQTADLLSQLVPQKAARKMAEAVHSTMTILLDDDLPKDLPKINHEDLGVWIDPIDATAEFIAGVRGCGDTEHGLPCVTVLIGAYLRDTGEPVMGIINQPFWDSDNGKGRIIWGVNYENTQKWSGSSADCQEEGKVVLMSSAEKPDISDKFKQSGWSVKSVPGAGHKLLKVALGEAAAYVVSQGTTFRWDTCAPHAILRAKGGDLLDCSTLIPVTYNDPDYKDTQRYSNSGGIIAYGNCETLEMIKRII